MTTTCQPPARNEAVLITHLQHNGLGDFIACDRCHRISYLEGFDEDVRRYKLIRTAPPCACYGIALVLTQERGERRDPDRIS